MDLIVWSKTGGTNQMFRFLVPPTPAKVQPNGPVTGSKNPRTDTGPWKITDCNSGKALTQNHDDRPIELQDTYSARHFDNAAQLWKVEPTRDMGSITLRMPRVIGCSAVEIAARKARKSSRGGRLSLSSTTNSGAWKM